MNARPLQPPHRVLETISLTSRALVLVQLVAGGAIDSHLALNSLTQAAQKSGLPTEEIAKTLASGFKAGKDNPRAAPEAQGSVSQSGSRIINLGQTQGIKGRATASQSPWTLQCCLTECVTTSPT